MGFIFDFYDRRILIMYLKKFYGFIKKAFLQSGGFYGTCNFYCACGHEAF
jgi:hypothetical protein